MYRKQKSMLWVWILMFMSGFCLFAGNATGDPLIITVSQVARVDAASPSETIESTVENGVEILTPRPPQMPTGLDEQLAFIPEPIAKERLDGQIERRRSEPSAPPHIVIDRWQPGVYSNIDVDRREPGSVPPIVEHRYHWPPDRPSRIETHRWSPDRASLIVTHRWLPDRASLIVTHRWLPDRPSLIVTHGIGL